MLVRRRNHHLSLAWVKYELGVPDADADVLQNLTYLAALTASKEKDYRRDYRIMVSHVDVEKVEG